MRRALKRHYESSLERATPRASTFGTRAGDGADRGSETVRDSRAFDRREQQRIPDGARVHHARTGADGGVLARLRGRAGESGVEPDPVGEGGNRVPGGRVTPWLTAVPVSDTRTLLRCT